MTSKGVALAVPQPVQTDPAKLRWGIVSTVKAPLRKIAEFAAYHLALGAHRIHLHLDSPDPHVAQRLAHPRLRFYQCDESYWQGAPKPAREGHQMRQAYNATRIYRISKLDWLAHIDVDEFLLPHAPMSQVLAEVSAQTTHLQVHHIEMMAGDGDPFYFKRRGSVKKLQKIFPTFGEHVEGGFISTLSPKVIARTGLSGIRLGIHALIHHGETVTSGAPTKAIDLGHAHAPDWETFKAHIDYRLTFGSYRHRKNRFNALGGLIEALSNDPDPNALRAFHTELCVPTPERLDLLAAHDMLVKWELNLTEKVKRFFGDLEGDA